MSLGYYGFGEKLAEDDTRVIYCYGSINLNSKVHRNNGRIMDGSIEIDKKYLVAPKIKRRTFKSKGQKRTVTEKVFMDVDVIDLIKNGHIKVESTKNCWSTLSEMNIDTVAYRLCRCIFNDYQEYGELKHTCAFGV